MDLSSYSDGFTYRIYTGSLGNEGEKNWHEHDRICSVIKTPLENPHDSKKGKTWMSVQTFVYVHPGGISLTEGTF